MQRLSATAPLGDFVARLPRLAGGTVGTGQLVSSDGVARARPAMSPRDLSLFAILGIVNEGFDQLHQVVAGARNFASPDWQPTGEVVAGAVSDAVSAGLLTRRPSTASAETERLAMTSLGRSRLRALLQTPLPARGGAAPRAAMALKVCFLGALPPKARAEVVSDLCHSHRSELDALRTRCARCPAGRRYARCWMDREVERIEQEIVWLERMSSDLCTANA